jgi:serine phosphatase RsbU (regulator of sigma subunit)
MLPGMSYESERRSLPAGARLLLYTDGLTEVFQGDEEFGPERLLDVFSGCQTEKAGDILDALWAATESFADGGPQGDDMTALVLCRETGVTEKPA